MKLDKYGQDFLKTQEGLRLKPYYCSAGTATISWGVTYYENGSKVKITDPEITNKRAEELFQHTVELYEHTIDQLVRSKLTQNQFNALVSFCYNVGIGAFKGSTLLKKVNANPADETIYYEFLKWNKEQKGTTKAGKPIFKENEGLTNRRQREARLYLGS